MTRLRPSLTAPARGNTSIVVYVASQVAEVLARSQAREHEAGGAR
jgi:hypothetical protein